MTEKSALKVLVILLMNIMYSKKGNVQESVCTHVWVYLGLYHPIQILAFLQNT